MEGENKKNTSPSKAIEEQVTPQTLEASTQTPPSLEVQGPHSSPNQGGPQGPPGDLGGRPPVIVHAIPVDGSAGDAIGSASGLVIDDASRKRAIAVGEEIAAPGGGNQVPFACTICGRNFLTSKSLFGHMRSHGGRTWKGAFPPPMFSREEFADTGLLNPEEGEEEEEHQEVEHVIQAAIPVVQEGAVVGVQEASNLNVLQTQALEPQVEYRVPDLNLPPQDEENGNGNDNKDD